MGTTVLTSERRAPAITDQKGALLKRARNGIEMQVYQPPPLCNFSQTISPRFTMRNQIKLTLTEFADLEPDEDVVPVVDLCGARLVRQAELGRPDRLADGHGRGLESPRRGSPAGTARTW